MLSLNPFQSFVEYIPDWSCLWLSRMLGIIDIDIGIGTTNIMIGTNFVGFLFKQRRNRKRKN